MALRILTILARYGTTAYPESKTKIDGIFSACLPSVKRHTIIVDNALPPEHRSNENGVEVIGGTSLWREFSGFDDAIRYLGSEIYQYDVVLLATAAFDQYYTRYIHRVTESMLQVVADYPIALGHIDAYNEMISAFGYESQYWLRSSFVYLAPTEVARLGPMAYVRNRSDLFTDNASAPWLKEAPISPTYRRLLTDWLTSSQGTGQGEEWHSRFALSDESLPLFRDKAIAIINEHMLTIRLRAQGCTIVDQTWLAGHLENDRALPPVWPGWRDQLKTRDDVVSIPTPSMRPT